MQLKKKKKKYVIIIIDKKNFMIIFTVCNKNIYIVLAKICKLHIRYMFVFHVSFLIYMYDVVNVLFSSVHAVNLNIYEFEMGIREFLFI